MTPANLARNGALVVADLLDAGGTRLARASN